MQADNLKSFFDEFAKELGFDPTDAQRWRLIRVKDIASKPVHLKIDTNNILTHISTQGGYALLNYWSFGDALRRAYPSLQVRPRQHATTEE